MIYVKLQFNNDPALGEFAGQSTDWEEVPVEGIPDLGYPADHIGQIDATLTNFETMGVFSLELESAIFTASFTHDPTKVV